MFLCIGVIVLLGLGTPAALLAQDNNSIQASRSFISTVWQKAVDWTVQTWNRAAAWVAEQGSQIARALTFWRGNNQPAAAKAPIAPQVLGEEEAAPPIKPVLPARSDLIANFQSPISNNQLITNNQIPITTPDPLPPVSETVPTPEPQLSTPHPDPLLGEERGLEDVAPLTTPEVLIEPAKEEAEPAKQNSSYYIPILARDTLAPSSSITAMATSTSSSFTVAWTGEDTDITGSPAVASYDIQYQVDSGAWTDWLSRTTLLSDLFTGALDEKIYGFRSRSRDRYDNLETYPNSADTSTYANLSVPVTPAVTSHTNGGTVMSNVADEDTSSGSTVQVTLSGTGEASNILTITLAETSTTATTTVSLLGAWSKQFTLAEGANNFTLQTRESDGDNSLSASFVLNLEMVPTREVVINELAWMGTAVSGADEWMELYNSSSTAIDLTGWTIAAATTGPTITLSGTIAAKSYFLLEHTDTNTVYDVAADQIYSGGTGNQMSDSGELLTLRDSTSKLIDKVGSSTAGWFFGDNSSAANRTTMERKDPAGDGTLSTNWATNDGTLINGKASDNATNIKGTPKSLNSVNTTIPRVVTDLQMQYVYTTTSSIRLYWTTPKTANLATTTPATYDIRYYATASANCPITESNWASATQATGEPTPSTVTPPPVATSTVSGLSTSTSYCFGIKTNNGSNDSAISNSYIGTTEDGLYTTIAGYPSGTSGLLASSTSPYLITGSIAIPNNSSLIIQPGTVIKMSPGLNITFGTTSTLNIGTSADGVNAGVITSRDDDAYNSQAKNSGGTVVSDGIAAAGDWGKILGSTGAVVAINHGIIKYGGASTPMMSFSAGTITINNSIIQNSNNHGLIVGGASTSLTLASSTISNMLDVGLGITSSAIANVQGSTFTANRRGISVDTPAAESSIIIRNNNFYANNNTTGDSLTPISGLHYADTSATLTAENNWWGSASGPTTSGSDGDPVRDAAMATGVGGVIDYDPPAASAFTILPNNL